MGAPSSLHQERAAGFWGGLLPYAARLSLGILFFPRATGASTDRTVVGAVPGQPGQEGCRCHAWGPSWSLSQPVMGLGSGWPAWAPHEAARSPGSRGRGPSTAAGWRGTLNCGARLARSPALSTGSRPDNETVSMEMSP